MQWNAGVRLCGDGAHTLTDMITAYEPHVILLQEVNIEFKCPRGYTAFPRISPGSLPRNSGPRGRRKTPEVPRKLESVVLVQKQLPALAHEQLTTSTPHWSSTAVTVGLESSPEKITFCSFYRRDNGPNSRIFASQWMEQALDQTAANVVLGGGSQRPTPAVECRRRHSWQDNRSEDQGGNWGPGYEPSRNCDEI